MNNPFETLGFSPEFEIDRAELEERYRGLQRALHPDRHRSAGTAERRMALLRAMEVNEAYRVLHDEQARAAALLRLNGIDESTEQADPAFLMEVMELREALGDARAARDLCAVGQLESQVRGLREQVRERLASGFRLLSSESSSVQALELARQLSQMRYYQRFLDEVRMIEDDLSA